MNFTDAEYRQRKKKTKREKFLQTMDEIMPWDEWTALIASYDSTGRGGHSVKDIETMLRMYLLQIWFNLSDTEIEDHIYDSYAMRSFMGIDFSDEQVPDVDGLMKFRQLLEKHGIDKKILDDIKQRLKENGKRMRGGSIEEAAIIHKPKSTEGKN